MLRGPALAGSTEEINTGWIHKEDSRWLDSLREPALSGSTKVISSAWIHKGDTRWLDPLGIYPLFNKYNILQPSQNLPPPLPEYTPPFSTTICDPSRIYPSLPEYISPFQQLYATLLESTSPSQNIPPFQIIIILCDPLRIYPSLTKYIPLSTTICDPPRIPPPPLFNKCIFATLPEYTPPRIYSPFNNYMRPSQNLPLPPRINPYFQQLFYYATLPESIPPFQNLPPFQQLYVTLSETTLPSEKTPFFCPPPPPSQTISPSSPFYNIPKFHPSVTTPLFWKLHVTMRESTTRSQN